jgi:hypothetical protein
MFAQRQISPKTRAIVPMLYQSGVCTNLRTRRIRITGGLLVLPWVDVQRPVTPLVAVFGGVDGDPRAVVRALDRQIRQAP